jgi:hypothetical protein
MIAAIDQFFVDRLVRITVDGTGLQAYAPGASRPKGKTALPCASVSLILGPYPDPKASRPHIDVFTPSQEERTIVIPAGQLGGGEYTGPAEWTWKKCPTPVEMIYQVDLETAEEAHMQALLLLILEALPVPYTAAINGQNVRILPEGTPTNLDELAKPLFRTAFRYLVTNVWIERLAGMTKPSIAEVDMEFSSQE